MRAMRMIQTPLSEQKKDAPINTSPHNYQPLPRSG
jgi:hypothetical protein